MFLAVNRNVWYPNPFTLSSAVSLKAKHKPGEQSLSSINFRHNIDFITGLVARNPTLSVHRSGHPEFIIGSMRSK